MGVTVLLYVCVGGGFKTLCSVSVDPLRMPHRNVGETFCFKRSKTTYVLYVFSFTVECHCFTLLTSRPTRIPHGDSVFRFLIDDLFIS